MDEQNLGHLRLLGIFHYVLGGMAVLFSLIWLIYIFLGAFIATAPDAFSSKNGEPPPEFFGWFLSGFGVMLMLIGWGVATLLFIAGRNLSNHRHHTFCMVVAAVACLFMPLGTILGVFTLVVLTQSGVKELFDAGTARAA